MLVFYKSFLEISGSIMLVPVENSSDLNYNPEDAAIQQQKKKT